VEHQAGLGTVMREWGRIGCVGFGGPPAHIALLRQLCVERKQWLDAQEFEDAIAACNLLPGPASTELAIFCAWRVRGRAGALAGGLAFILPGLACILALSALFLAGTPPLWVKGAGAGAGAAAAGGGVLAGVAWVAFKVGALSFGGGFVIIPLMRADAVGRGWMTSSQFLNAVALGQITPGPVVQTVSAVGYAAAGVGGGLLAALVAFSPSFVFVLGGARYFSVLRTSRVAQTFLDGAGPAAIGAILGSAVLLAGTLREPWQFAVLAAAAVLLLAPQPRWLRRGVVFTLLAAAAAGLLIALAGGPLPH
jgi:chromate transporter